MFKIIRNGEVYNPLYMSVQDLLIAGEKIVRVSPQGEIPLRFIRSFEVEEIDASGKIIVPGFIDQHVHITGGGGEGGPATRTPEINLSQLTTAGVTTVVGLLGFDGVTRQMYELLAKARALEAEGITAYVLTGAYEIPTRTVTGNIRSDLVLIDKVIGSGEIAIADHRSAQPTLEMLIHLAAETRTGGLLGNKPGIVHVHVGEGKHGLSLLFEAVAQSDIPITQFVPTHVNRLAGLFQEAVNFHKQGGVIDLTAGITPKHDSPQSLEICQALEILVRGKADLGRVTVSSDANGSLPQFDKAGRLIKMGVSPASVLWADVAKTVRENIISLSEAISLISHNVAKLLGLFPEKGLIAPGSDADLVLLDKDLNIDTVFARGRLMVKDGLAVVKGNFEQD